MRHIGDQAVYGQHATQAAPFEVVGYRVGLITCILPSRSSVRDILLMHVGTFVHSYNITKQTMWL